MKKTTKIAITVAAMAAMTIGAATTAFAAEVWTPSSEGWKVAVDGTQVKNQWYEAESGRWYHINSSGYMDTNTFIERDGKIYFVDSEGALCTGWNRINVLKSNNPLDSDMEASTPSGGANIYKDDQAWFYFDASGVAKADQWYQIPDSQRWYYFADNGAMYADGELEESDKIYRVDKNGAMCTGWYSANQKDLAGTPVESVKSEGNWLYYKANGQKLFNSTKAFWEKIGDSYYYFEKTGLMVAEKVITADDDTFFYVDKNGVMATSKTAEIAKSVSSYRSNTNGATVTDGGYTFTNTDQKAKMKFGSDGRAVLGRSGANYFLQVGDKIVSVKPEKSGVYTGAYSDIAAKTSQVVSSAGAQVEVSSLIISGDDLYLIDKNGNIVTGEVTIAEATLYFQSNGKALTGSGSVKYGSKTYDGADTTISHIKQGTAAKVASGSAVYTVVN